MVIVGGSTDLNLIHSNTGHAPTNQDSALVKVDGNVRYFNELQFKTKA